MSHILEVEGLTTVFDGDGGQMTSADGISFYVDPGEIAVSYTHLRAHET